MESKVADETKKVKDLGTSVIANTMMNKVECIKYFMVPDKMGGGRNHIGDF